MFRKAAEAAELTKEKKEIIDEQTMKNVEYLIEKAIKNGEYNCFYHGELPNKIKKELKNNGYKIRERSLDGYGSRYITIISW